MTGVELGRRFAWTCVLLAALTDPVAAQQPSAAQQNAIRQNCRADYQAHCSGVPTGGAAALNCLQDNTANLSGPCRQALSAVGGGAHPAPSGEAGATPPGGPVPASPAPPPSRRERAYILRQACGGDFQRQCHGVPLGGGHAIECLVAHREALSPGCQRALSAARQ